MGLGSGIRDPGVKKAPDPGSGSATLFYGITVPENRTQGNDQIYEYTLHRLNNNSLEQSISNIPL